MSADWYYQKAGKVVGPVEWETLKRLAWTRRIDPDTLICEGEEGEWVAARTEMGLRDAFPGEAAEGIAVRPADAAPLAPRPVLALLDEDAPAPPGDGARTALSALGVATIVFAALFTLGGVTSAVAAVYCFIIAADLDAKSKQDSQAAQAASQQPGGGAAASSLGCSAAMGQFLAALYWTCGVASTIAAVVHLLLAGGHFAGGFGVLKRRPWARVVTLVFASLTGVYGGLGLFGVVVRLAQSPAPTGGDAGGLALTVVVGLVFVAYAVLAWVALTHRRCVAQFRRSADAVPAD
jgi:hypothetical protein